MDYLAHINEKGEEQLLKQHLENTALRCGSLQIISERMNGDTVVDFSMI